VGRVISCFFFPPAFGRRGWTSGLEGYRERRVEASHPERVPTQHRADPRHGAMVGLPDTQMPVGSWISKSGRLPALIALIARGVVTWSHSAHRGCFASTRDKRRQCFRPAHQINDALAIAKQIDVRSRGQSGHAVPAPDAGVQHDRPRSHSHERALGWQADLFG
jgi:hypothetical protein